MGRSLDGIAVAVMVMAIAGCGDNGAQPFITGTFLADVDVHEKPCGVQVDPSDTSDPWFVPMTGWTFDIVEHMDKPYPFYYSCWVHTTEPCDVLVATAFETARWNGWDRILVEASGSPGDCTFAYGFVSLTQDGDRMIVDTTWHKQTGVDADACTQAEAVARRMTMPCYKHEHVEGTLQR